MSGSADQGGGGATEPVRGTQVHTGRVAERSEIRWWERMLLVLFALFLIGADTTVRPVALALVILGGTILLSAIGAVELAMALAYRTRSELRSRARSDARRRR